MIVEAARYEEYLKAKGSGVFSKVEYDFQDQVVLRTSDLKTSDLSGTVRLYFSNQREQLMTGRRFDPMPSGLVLLRPGAFYRVYTTIEIVKPLPEGLSAMVVLTEDAEDIMMVTAKTFREGFVGQVIFTIQPFRRLEIEKMTTMASLVFFGETVNIDDEWLKVLENKVSARVLKEVNKVLKKVDSDRTKKTTKPASKKPATPKKAEVTTDESSIPGEHADDKKD